MRAILFFIFTCFVSCFSNAQILEIKGTGANLFLEHSVAPKENFYSIGRLYNVPPKELASYNSLSFENGLSIGQSLKIPLTANNFTQSSGASASASLVPVIHQVQPKEGLYRISVNYNKVPMEAIKKWNRLPGDDIGLGEPLIVGYLKVNKGESALTANSRTHEASVAQQQPVEKKVVAKAEPKNVETEPEKENSQANVATPPSTKTVAVATKGASFAGGYFKRVYDDQVTHRPAVDANGSGSVFKSNTGWKDGKYYCFNNEALPGSVIEVTNTNTGKRVYAKVLDVIPEIKQNEGLAVVISNSAAEELGAGNGNFNCAIRFVR